MKLESTMKAQVIAMGTEQSRDGKTTYYRIAILQGMETGKLGCPEDVYNKIEKGKEYTFITQFNDEYKSFRITGLIQEPLKHPATTVPGK